MAFPAGATTITVTGTYPAPAGGAPRTGTIIFTPSARLVDSTQHAIYSGGGNADLDANGQFSIELLCTDDTDVQPAGWQWQVDEQITDGSRATYWIDLPSSLGATIDLDELSPVSGPGGGTSSSSNISPSSTVVAETSYGQASTAGSATAYSRGDHSHGTPALPTTGTTAGTYAAGDDSRLSDARTPTAHAASHGAAGSDAVTLTQAQITGLTAALAALAPLAGATFTGVVTIDNTDFTVSGTDKGFRFRPTGSALDLEAAGADFLLSVWSGTAIGSGTQRSYFRFSADAQNTQLAGKLESVASLYGTAVHTLDPETGVASLGRKNNLANILIAGRLATNGAPTTGAWAAGDTVQDAAGAWWFCTASGTPGVWVCVGSPTPWQFDVTHYGAVGDGQTVTDGAMTSGSAVLACPTSTPFAAGDVGKTVIVLDAGPSGVTSLVSPITGFTDTGQVTLADTAAVTVSNAIVMFGTDDSAAFTAAGNAAVTWALAHSHAATLKLPAPPNGEFYMNAGALQTGGTTLGNAQFPLPVVPADGPKVTLTIEGPSNAAGVQHWQQTVPQLAGATIVSAYVHASSAAQTASINADGNPCVIGGPAQPGGYGVAPGVFSNMHVVVRNLSVLTTHSSHGLTLSAFDFSGVANVTLENVAYGTAATVAGGDYGSPNQFANGLAPGLLMPADGNNDLCHLHNVTCLGGYTYGILATEHCEIYGMRILYCWAGFCPVGTYYSSVGSTHATVAPLISIEACTYVLYAMGVGSSGIGPFLNIWIDTETSTPRFGDNTSGNGLRALRGNVVLTGLYAASGLTLDHPVGCDIVNGQLSYAAIAVSDSYTATVFDESVEADASTAAFTVTAPTAAGRAKRLVATKTDASANAVTIAAAAGETINGSASTSLAAQWDTVELLPLTDGTGWIAR